MAVLSSRASVELLSARLRPLGFKVKGDRLLRLLDHMGGDVDLAVCAFTLKPWPSWLSEIVGPREKCETR